MKYLKNIKAAKPKYTCTGCPFCTSSPIDDTNVVYLCGNKKDGYYYLGSADAHKSPDEVIALKDKPCWISAHIS